MDDIRTEEEVEVTEVEATEEDDAIMLNTDLDEIPDAEPFEDGEKLCTLTKVSTAIGKESGDKFLKLEIELPEDEYAGHVFQNVIPPNPNQKDGGVYCKQNWLEYMAILGIEHGPGGWMFRVAEGRSFYAIVKMDTKNEGFALKPQITRLLKPVE